MKKLLTTLFALICLNGFANPQPRPEYPRPQFERSQWVNLNGTWNFEFDFGESGKDRSLQKAEQLSQQITVPFCPESKLSGVAHTDFINCLWYQRKLSIPADWSGKKILLNFGAVDYYTEIYIDGEFVQSHWGGSSSFSADITRFVKSGQTHNLVLQVKDDLRSGKQTGGKQCTNFYSGGCSYTRVTGIWQTVWMEAVDKKGLKTAVVRPDIDQKQLIITPEFYQESNNTLEIVLKDGNKTVAKKSVTCSNSSTIILPVKNMKLWSPENPFLYDLVYQVKDQQGNIIDEVKSYAGMRKVHTADGIFYLNNEPYFQRLVLDQGYYPDGVWTAPSDEALKNDIVLGKEAGFNGARLHQKVFEERYYYWADKLGYLTWGESASWVMDINDELAVRNYIGEWTEVVARDRNHPSLVTWTPFNETWGSREGVYPRLIRDIYHITKSIDPTRPINDASGDDHILTDIWSVHNYEQDGSKLAEQLEFKEEKEPYRNSRDKKFLAVYEGQPYMVDEFGGIGWMSAEERKNSWGYGNIPQTPEEFYTRLESQVKALKDAKHVMGFCYTQLTDVEQEKNGIYYYNRTPKLDMKRIKAIFELIPSSHTNLK
ncbi:glycoside hydrolase family 2 protein [Phocaeicola faecium]|uniref:Beta-glucuronidase n=1 Tax=Phocaeicola faecium TaxID=2762213 RepID=A0ABR8VDR6_9BACT|nr:sugar-binding domain-containing protein [Phocaeicola faecium]MBD8002922.1 beta-glucuronidase [Phocaeicola faecium]